MLDNSTPASLPKSTKWSRQGLPPSLETKSKRGRLVKAMAMKKAIRGKEKRVTVLVVPEYA